MTRVARVAVVIPAYRVASHVGRVVAQLPAGVAHVLVVDDACPDKSGDVAAALGDPRVEVLRHPENRGVGGALKTGYRRAIELRADVVIKMDGDDQMDPARIPELIAPLLEGRADYAKGNRFRDRRALTAMPPLRRVGNWGLSFWSKLAAGYWALFDPTNGFTAIRGEALRELDLDALADRYYFEISMLAELNTVGAAAVDVAIPARYGDERSSLSISRVLIGFPPRLFSTMLRRWWTKYYVRDFTPVALFLTSGFPVLSFGVLVGAWFWIKSIRTGVPTTAGQVMLAGLPVLVGLQLLLQALVADIHAAPTWRERPPLGAPEGLGSREDEGRA